MCHTARNTTGNVRAASFVELSQKSASHVQNLFGYPGPVAGCEKMNKKTTQNRDSQNAKMRLIKLICIYHPAQTCSRTVPGGSQRAAVQKCEHLSGPEIRGQEAVAPGGADGGGPP